MSSSLLAKLGSSIFISIEDHGHKRKVSLVTVELFKKRLLFIRQKIFDLQFLSTKLF
jgi:hypothetical protein